MSLILDLQYKDFKQTNSYGQFDSSVGQQTYIHHEKISRSTERLTTNSKGFEELNI